MGLWLGAAGAVTELYKTGTTESTNDRTPPGTQSHCTLKRARRRGENKPASGPVASLRCNAPESVRLGATLLATLPIVRALLAHKDNPESAIVHACFKAAELPEAHTTTALFRSS